jgi:hypothetical protein
MNHGAQVRDGIDGVSANGMLLLSFLSGKSWMDGWMDGWEKWAMIMRNEGNDRVL